MEQPLHNKTAVDGVRETVLRLSLARFALDIWLARIFLLAILGIGIVSWIYGVSPENIPLFPCPFYMLTHIKCPGCGMTRACISIVHGDLHAAWHYHPFSFGLMLLATGIALIPNSMHRGWQKFPPFVRNVFIWGLLVLLIGFWAYRLTL